MDARLEQHLRQREKDREAWREQRTSLLAEHDGKLIARESRRVATPAKKLPLGDAIDLAQILVEELALAIDPYPRLAGVEIGEFRHAGPGVAPLEPEELRPFAALSALRDKLGKGGH